MENNTIDDLEKLATEELQKIVHQGENLHVSTSRASIAKRILESRWQKAHNQSL